MSGFIVRGVPQSILKDGWWLAETTTEPNTVAKSAQRPVFWKRPEATANVLTSKPLNAR